jgi:FkbM family methyltransferase
MSLGSIVRYRDYCRRGQSDSTRKLKLKMKRPVRAEIVFREVPSDHYTFGDIFEQEVYKTVLRHVPNCSTILDLGANIGFASLYLAAAYPAARIVSVEPNRENFALLKTNLNVLIRQGRCIPLQAAVWSTRRSLGVDPRWSAGAYNAFRVLDQPTGDGAADSVEGLTMAEILSSARFQQVDLLKVDIEGAEVELFRNDRGWLDSVRAIAIEFHGQSRSESGFDEILKNGGFTVCEEDSHTVLAVRSSSAPRDESDSTGQRLPARTTKS